MRTSEIDSVGAHRTLSIVKMLPAWPHTPQLRGRVASHTKPLLRMRCCICHSLVPRIEARLAHLAGGVDELVQALRVERTIGSEHKTSHAVLLTLGHWLSTERLEPEKRDQREAGYQRVYVVS